MTPLTVRLQQYIAVRRSLGYDLSFPERVLRRFAEFADRERADHITVDLFLRWKEHYGSANNYTWSRRLSMVRVFASWLQGFDPRTEVPPPGLISNKPRRTRPYIYTDDQIAEIVTEAGRLPSSYGLRGWTCSTLFGLIAVTGLRVSEAIGLDDKDVDLNEAVLAIRRSKNGKSRFVPLSASAAERMRAYRAERNRILGDWPSGVLPAREWRTPQRLLRPLQLRAGLPANRPARAAGLQQTWPRPAHPRSAAYLRGAHDHGLVSARPRSGPRDAQAQHLSGAHPP